MSKGTPQREQLDSRTKVNELIPKCWASLCETVFFIADLITPTVPVKVPIPIDPTEGEATVTYWEEKRWTKVVCTVIVLPCLTTVTHMDVGARVVV